MGWLQSLILRIRALFMQKQLDEDLDEELAFHLAMKQQSLEGDGVDAAAAIRQARRAMGNPAFWKESTRDAWIFTWLEGFWRDVVFGVRVLAKDRVFTAVALVTLTLGIGANTAVFSLINGLLLRALPVKDPDQLVRIQVTNLPPGEMAWENGRSVPAVAHQHISYAQLKALDRQSTFTGVFGRMSLGSTVVESEGTPYKVNSDWVTGSYFPVLGVKPHIGRLLTPEDDIPGGPSTGWPVVISNDLWTKLFNRDHRALGAHITIERVPFIVVGVAPWGFYGINPGSEIEAWVPLSSLEILKPEMPWRNNPGWTFLQTMGRLNTNISFQQARQKLSSISRGIFEETQPKFNAQYQKLYLAQKIDLVSARSGFSWVGQAFGKSLWILLSAVGAVLLISSTNLTNLLFARATARRQEIAVRLALGASARRVRRQLLVECGIVAITGTLFGVLFAQWLTSALERRFSIGDWTHIDTHLDWTMFGFLAAVLTIVVLISGWMPAWAASRNAIYTRTKENTSSTWTVGLRSGLVIFQIALSVALLGGAGLLINSLAATFRETAGFDRSAKLFARPELLSAGITREKLPTAYANILEATRRQPEVRAAAWMRSAPLTGYTWLFTINAPGSRNSSQHPTVHSDQVTDGYFAAMGLPILAGRDFATTSSDRKACIVSDNLARYFFGSAQAALGQMIRGGALNNAEIIGVVSNSKYTHIREETPMIVYFPYWDAKPDWTMTLVVSHSGSHEPLLGSLRTIFQKEAGRIPMTQFKNFDENVAESLVVDRLLTTLLTAFSTFALLISATGIAGLLSYTVQLRRKEIGIRMALGAEPSMIRTYFQRQGIFFGIVGLLLGGLFSYWLRHAIDAYLFHTESTDFVVWGSVSIILLISTFAAAAIPAYRASRLNPMQTLQLD